MKISIVTPSYNQDKYLAICIRSVLMQKYVDIEHIVVDGCSTDRSVEILDGFKEKDSRLHYISEFDSGQGEAVNKGFALATGEIIAWINSDDFYFDDNVFHYVVEFFNMNPDIDILYGGMAYVNEKNDIDSIRIPPKFNAKTLEYISYIGNTNSFYRRSIIEQHRLDENFHFVIDHEFMIRITKDYVTKQTETLLACFRVHEDAKTQTMSESEKDIERMRRDMTHGIKRNAISKIREFNARLLYKWQLFFSNLQYLRKYRSKPPFEIFIRS